MDSKWFYRDKKCLIIITCANIVSGFKGNEFEGLNYYIVIIMTVYPSLIKSIIRWLLSLTQESNWWQIWMARYDKAWPFETDDDSKK